MMNSKYSDIIKNADFNKQDGLLPAIIQDIHSGVVLMLGYMNEEALKKTLEEEKVTFFSRTKNRLWTKGEESGSFLFLKSIKLDCDNDTLHIMAEPVGPVCHKGTDTCWGDANSEQYSFLFELEKLIRDRKVNPKEGSYTNHLFEKGINKIAQKVGEEAVELVIEAKDNNKDLFTNEAADLLYHLLVLLAEKDIELGEIVDILKERHK
jgi:phosphoribosyl-AMP cyclohydrolase / phosphoribosyl-ATP pyrophosphohydrolase